MWFEDKSYVNDGDEEIATLQTECFSKPVQNPVFLHFENAESDFEEGSSRGGIGRVEMDGSRALTTR